MQTDISLGTIAVLNRGATDKLLTAWLVQVARRWPYLPEPLLPEGNQIARQRNMAAEAMQGSWVLYVDSDCVPYNTEVLPELLACEAPIVSGVVLERHPPFRVAAGFPGGGRWALEDLPREGYVPVPWTGAACLLVRRQVFDALPRPWFRCGQLHPEFLDEDSEFGLRAAEAGFQPMLACAARVGHRAEGVLWPGRNGKRWVQWPGPVDCREELTVGAPR